MNRSAVWMAVGAAAVTLMAQPALAELKIGVVSSARLLQASPQYSAMKSRLDAEFGPRQKDIVALQTALQAKVEKYQKDKDTMSAEQRTRTEKELTEGQRDYQQKVSNFNEDISKSQEQEAQRVQAELAEEISTFARDNKFDLILADGIAYANSSVDLTDAIVAVIKAKGAAAPAAATAPAKPSTPAPAKK